MKVGLVLSGGGSRGIAHLGVIKALEEMEIPIDMIAGSSSGAIAGALYASGNTPDDILNIIRETKFLRLVKPVISKSGLLKMESAEVLYRRYILEDSFEKLNIPLTIATTDLARGTTVYFSKGPLIRPLMASTCIPVVFDPVRVNGRLYVDGGLLDNFPAEVLVGKCDKIIGVHCNPVNDEFKSQNIKSMLERTFLLAINANAYGRQPHCDLFIEPPLLKKFGLFDLNRAEEIFQIGYEYALSMEKEICAIHKTAITH